MLHLNDVQSETTIESEIVDVYAVKSNQSQTSKPFKLKVQLSNRKGGEVEVEAMVAAIDSKEHQRLKEKIEGWSESGKLLQMADKNVVPAKARWKGKVRIKGAEVDCTCEVFDSGGSWKFLLGKPLLEKFRAVQDYAKGLLTVEDDRRRKRTIFNKGLGKALSKEYKGKDKREAIQTITPLNVKQDTDKVPQIPKNRPRPTIKDIEDEEAKEDRARNKGCTTLLEQIEHGTNKGTLNKSPIEKVKLDSQYLQAKENQKPIIEEVEDQDQTAE